jgi:hypothetical protein
VTPSGAGTAFFSHRVLSVLAIVVTTLTAICSAITLAGGDALGISAYAVAWIGVLGSVLGTVNGFLPAIKLTNGAPTGAPTTRTEGADDGG